MSDEFKNAMDWLASVEVHSEAEASNKELILSEIEEIAKMIEEKTPLTISFEIKEPRTIIDSSFNTLILLINEISCSYQNLSYPGNSKEQDSYSRLIRQAKIELDGLREYIIGD